MEEKTILQDLDAVLNFAKIAFIVTVVIIISFIIYTIIADKYKDK